MRAMIESMGGRKFLLALGAGAISSILVWFGRITPDVYQWVILGTVAAYITGNAAQKIKAPGRGPEDGER